MDHIGANLKNIERNIKLDGFDRISSAGFTMYPNAIQNDPNLELGVRPVSQPAAVALHAREHAAVAEHAALEHLVGAALHLARRAQLRGPAVTLLRRRPALGR